MAELMKLAKQGYPIVRKDGTPVHLATCPKCLTIILAATETGERLQECEHFKKFDPERKLFHIEYTMPHKPRTWSEWEFGK